jgi:hypothetical protein
VSVADVRAGTRADGLGPTLVVRLRLSRAPGFDQPRGSADWDPGHRAVLWVAAGARYDQLSATVRPAARQTTAGGHEADPDGGPDDGTVVTLEFPRPPQPGPLRLELPAAAWGGRGQLKFAIPALMVKW